MKCSILPSKRNHMDEKMSNIVCYSRGLKKKLKDQNLQRNEGTKNKICLIKEEKTFFIQKEYDGPPAGQKHWQVQENFNWKKTHRLARMMTSDTRMQIMHMTLHTNVWPYKNTKLIVKHVWIVRIRKTQ